MNDALRSLFTEIEDCANRWPPRIVEHYGSATETTDLVQHTSAQLHEKMSALALARSLSFHVTMIGLLARELRRQEEIREEHNL